MSTPLHTIKCLRRDWSDRRKRIVSCVCVRLVEALRLIAIKRRLSLWPRKISFSLSRSLSLVHALIRFVFPFVCAMIQFGTPPGR